MVRMLKRLALAGLLGAVSLAMAGPAAAEGFVNTRAGWLALTPEAKAAYVQGLNDALNYTYIDDTLNEALAKRGRTRCLVEQRVTAAILSAQISTAYEEEAYARMSPVAVYVLSIGELCRPYINRERAEFGLSVQ